MESDGTPEVERDVQKSYWLEHSSNPTVEAMMLDSKAAEIDTLERPEVCRSRGIIRLLEDPDSTSITGDGRATAASCVTPLLQPPGVLVAMLPPTSCLHTIHYTFNKLRL